MQPLQPSQSTVVVHNGSEINLSYMESDFTTVITSPIVHSFGGQTLWGRGR